MRELYCSDSSIGASDYNDFALLRVDGVSREYVRIRAAVHSLRKLKGLGVHIRIDFLCHICDGF
jgi:hypothetical protein